MTKNHEHDWTLLEVIIPPPDITDSEVVLGYYCDNNDPCEGLHYRNAPTFEVSK